MVSPRCSSHVSPVRPGTNLRLTTERYSACAATDAKQQIGAAGEGGAGVALVREKAERLGQGCGFENGKGHVYPQRMCMVMFHIQEHITCM